MAMMVLLVMKVSHDRILLRLDNLEKQLLRQKNRLATVQAGSLCSSCDVSVRKWNFNVAEANLGASAERASQRKVTSDPSEMSIQHHPLRKQSGWDKLPGTM